MWYRLTLQGKSFTIILHILRAPPLYILGLIPCQVRNAHLCGHNRSCRLPTSWPFFLGSQPHKIDGLRRDAKAPCGERVARHAPTPASRWERARGIMPRAFAIPAVAPEQWTSSRGSVRFLLEGSILELIVAVSLTATSRARGLLSPLCGGALTFLRDCLWHRRDAFSFGPEAFFLVVAR